MNWLIILNPTSYTAQPIKKYTVYIQYLIVLIFLKRQLSWQMIYTVVDNVNYWLFWQMSNQSLQPRLLAIC